jgi:serine/threonine protein kinase
LSRAVASDSLPVKFPDPGERFGKYHLDSILGVGGVARVYLATEDELGGRRLAIKVSASFGQEPSILAKLDHRNIVPILTVAESESGLRGICMPYRPGLTLEELIRRIGRGTPPRAARAISDFLLPRECPAGFPPEEQRVGWTDFPIGRTFPEAVAWVGLALAQALSYLHKQGIYHRDIKPANILLAYREGPQLLDFNLAQVPNNPEGATAAQKGGTLPYMAPEQLKAFLDPSAWEGVEEAADLYSLGLVLRELLTGRAPELPKPQGSLAREIQELIDRRKIPLESIREINPGVPPALDSIIGKCLAFLPADRYAGANDLAADLGRFVERKPLLNAPNPSRVELGVNWTYRNRHGVVATVLSSVILFSLLGFVRQDDLGRGEFLRAEACYDSGTLDGLLEAKTAFQKLELERRHTARSSVGLALTLRKLEELDPLRFKSSKEISDLFREADQKSDAEEVIRERLKKEPDSPLLLLNLGLVLSEQKREFAAARPFLERSLEKDPDGFAALLALASLDQKTGDVEKAVLQLTKAIKVGQEKDVGEQRVYAIRKSLLYNLVKLIDRGIAGGLRTEVDAYRRQLEANLASFQSEDWERVEADGGKNLHLFNVNYYAGCLLSIRGVLDPEASNPPRSGGLFDEALERFKEASSLADHLKSPNDRKQQVKQQIDILERRRSLTISRL